MLRLIVGDCCGEFGSADLGAAMLVSGEGKEDRLGDKQWRSVISSFAFISCVISEESHLSFLFPPIEMILALIYFSKKSRKMIVK